MAYLNHKSQIFILILVLQKYFTLKMASLNFSTDRCSTCASTLFSHLWTYLESHCWILNCQHGQTRLCMIWSFLLIFQTPCLVHMVNSSSIIVWLGHPLLTTIGIEIIWTYNCCLIFKVPIELNVRFLTLRGKYIIFPNQLVKKSRNKKF